MLTTQHLDSPIKRYGGKTFLADWICSNIPENATHYVEAYAGGLSVLLRRNPEGVSEVVNDLDGELMNFWSTLRNESDFQKLVRKIEATPFSSEEFDTAGIPNPNDSKVDRAVKFFVRCRQSRQGLQKCFATLSKTRTRRGMNEQVSSWLTAIDGLPEIHDRLKRVVIVNGDAVTLIRREDSPSSFFYLDPPYVPETRVVKNAYSHEMMTEAHKRLLETLVEVKGRFLLSGYRSPLYDDFAIRHGWTRVDREIDCKASSAKVKPIRMESLWMNYCIN